EDWRMPDLIQILRKPPSVTDLRASASSAQVDWPVVAERLREYAAVRVERAAPVNEERCDLCGAAIEVEHGHLVNVPTRTLLCACRPCSLLFTHDGAGGQRFRAVPTRYRRLSDFSRTSGNWDALDIPIGLAFFFRNSATGRTTAFYPSPAGPVESELPL